MHTIEKERVRTLLKNARADIEAALTTLDTDEDLTEVAITNAGWALCQAGEEFD